MNNCWLPAVEYLDNYNNDWSKYETALYDIFKSDFIDGRPCFRKKPVMVKHFPIEFGKEDAYFHVTCKGDINLKGRIPDLRRCERIRWIRAFIEDYDCDPSLCENCDGVKVWDEPYKSRMRVHLLLEEERYMVVLERRDRYYLLVTAFYIDRDHSLITQLKHYSYFGDSKGSY